jgi:hypothetical protein
LKAHIRRNLNGRCTLSAARGDGGESARNCPSVPSWGRDASQREKKRLFITESESTTSDTRRETVQSAGKASKDNGEENTRLGKALVKNWVNIPSDTSTTKGLH